MSNNWENDLFVWVGDLDDYINIDAISREYVAEQQKERLDSELAEIGKIKLLNGKEIDFSELYHNKDISLSTWRHAMHQAEMAIELRPDGHRQHVDDRKQSPETRFVKGMLDLGRPYAIARYARWEHLDYPTALTATLPHGIRALVNQLLAAEGITRDRTTDQIIRAVWGPNKVDGMTAYSRAGLLQAALHQIADRAYNQYSHPCGMKLDRDRMRNMLSLARLHFSTSELRQMSIDELRLLLDTYRTERANLERDDTRLTTNGRIIRAWRKRHVQPLINLYPYAIRHGLRRAVAHGAGSFDPKTLANELALAHCEILRMREAGRNRTRSR